MRLGLIGLGRIGAFHADTLVGIPAIESLVVTDLVPEKTKQIVDRHQSDGVEGVDSLEALLASGVDGVIIAAGTDAHTELVLEVSPFLHEDGGDVELLAVYAQVRAQRQPDLLRRPEDVRDRIEAGMERACPFAHRLVEQVLLRVDVRVERALLHSEGLRDFANRCAVVTLLREQPGGLTGQLGTSLGHAW